MSVEGVQVVIFIVRVIVVAVVLHAAATVVLMVVSVGAATRLEESGSVDEDTCDGENNLLHLRQDALRVLLVHLVSESNMDGENNQNELR